MSISLDFQVFIAISFTVLWTSYWMPKVCWKIVYLTMFPTCSIWKLIFSISIRHPVTLKSLPTKLRKMLQGYSKDKRPDLVQTVIGLAVTREGIPIKVWSWPGNTMDMNVIEEVKKDLMGWRLGRIIHVMDRGFSSEENLRILQRGAGHYIIGERMRAGKKDVEAALSKRGRFHAIRENLLVKESIDGDSEARNRNVIAYNTKEAERDRRKRK